MTNVNADVTFMRTFAAISSYSFAGLHNSETSEASNSYLQRGIWWAVLTTCGFLMLHLQGIVTWGYKGSIALQWDCRDYNWIYLYISKIIAHVNSKKKKVDHKICFGIQELHRFYRQKKSARGATEITASRTNFTSESTLHLLRFRLDLQQIMRNVLTLQRIFSPSSSSWTFCRVSPSGERLLQVWWYNSITTCLRFNVFKYLSFVVSIKSRPWGIVLLITTYEVIERYVIGNDRENMRMVQG